MRGELPSTTSPKKAKTSSSSATPSPIQPFASINDKLPVRWVGDNIVAGDQRFSAREHTLALIYPNPLDPEHYVVLNSGLTFGPKDFQGTNALFYPRLGDYAIIRKSDGAVVLAVFSTSSGGCLPQNGSLTYMADESDAPAPIDLTALAHNLRKQAQAPPNEKPIWRSYASR